MHESLLSGGRPARELIRLSSVPVVPPGGEFLASVESFFPTAQSLRDITAPNKHLSHTDPHNTCIYFGACYLVICDILNTF